MTDAIVVVGAGGHARVLVDVLSLLGLPIKGYVASQDAVPPAMSELKYLGDDEALTRLGAKGILLVNAVGGTDVALGRREVFDRLCAGGFSFATLIHPSAIVAKDVVVDAGAQIMAGAVVQPGTRIGRNVLVNTRAVVDHDACLGDHVHVATGAVIAGGVTVGEASHIGAGAIVI